MQTRPGTLRRWTIALLCCAAAALPACSGGSDSPSENPTTVISFTPGGATPARGFFLRQGGGTSGTRLKLELVAADVTNVHSLDFVLELPPNIVRREGQSLGPFLNQNGVTAVLVALQLPSPLNGVLVSAVRPTNSGVSGSGVVMTFEIEALVNGSGRIDLESPEAADPLGAPIAGLSWIGGTVSVQR